MKKSFSILLIALIYLIVSSGVYISMHYCGGKFRNFSLANHAEDGCCCGSKDKNKNCCKEKALYIKVKDIHKSVDLLKIPHSYEKLLIGTGLSVLDLNYSFVISDTKFPDHHKRPPPTSSTPLYLNNRVLII